MLILESFSFSELDGSIVPNILPKMSFSTLGLCNFLITFSPQKVKKIVTFCPVAAAPLARTKVASALSKSSLNIIRVLPLLSHVVVRLQAWGSPFSMTTTDFPPVLSLEINLFPVELHHAAASRENPGSVATISTLSPRTSVSIVFFIFRTGPGHCDPQASTRIVLGFAAVVVWGASAVTEGFAGLSCAEGVSSVSSFSCKMMGAVAAR